MRLRAIHVTSVLLASVAIAMCVVTIAPPLVAPGFPAGHDAPAHLTYMHLFDTAFDQGQFPVRWVEWIRPGHSQPLFSFYQPGYYYAVQLLHAASPSLLLAAKLTVLVAWWGGAAFLFLYLRPLGVWPAALGALLFLRAPYLILDVFVRAALPEFVALSLAPVVLWSLDRTLRAPSWAHALGFAASSAGMLVCHLPTVLMFLPVYSTYAAAVWLSGAAGLAPLTRVTAGAVLAVGLASFYVVPALVELPLTSMRALTSEYFAFSRHFVEPWQLVSSRWGYGASETGTADGMSFQLGIAQWIALGAGAAAAVAAIVRGTIARTWPLFYWLSIAAAALFMTIAVSAPIWSAIPWLAFLQFPWRFLTVASLAASVAGAIALSSVTNRVLQAAVVVCAAAGLLWQTQHLLAPSHYFPREWVRIDNPGWRYSAGASRLAFIEPGYYPAGVARSPNERVARWEITRGTGDVSARRALDHRVELDVEAKGAIELTIRSHAFPGWRVLVDGHPVSWRRDPRFGFIVVDVPEGTHTVVAEFGDTPVRAWANRVSALSLAILGASVAAVGVSAVRRRRAAVT